MMCGGRLRIIPRTGTGYNWTDLSDVMDKRENLDASGELARLEELAEEYGDRVVSWIGGRGKLSEPVGTTDDTGHVH
jgi:hypothetical protein